MTWGDCSVTHTLDIATQPTLQFHIERTKRALFARPTNTLPCPRLDE
jgi:hypothetical protein